MKKVLSFIVLAVSLFFANPAQAQIKLGVKGGLNVSNLKLDDDMWKADNKAGFFIGLMVKVTVPVTGLSLTLPLYMIRRRQRCIGVMWLVLTLAGQPPSSNSISIYLSM